MISIPKLVFFDTNSLHRGGTIFNFQFSTFKFSIFHNCLSLMQTVDRGGGTAHGRIGISMFHSKPPYFYNLKHPYFYYAMLVNFCHPLLERHTMHIALGGCCAVTSRVQNCTQSLNIYISHCCQAPIFDFVPRA